MELIPWEVHRMAAYLRVSSKPQRDKGNSLEAQEWHVKEYFRMSSLEWPPEEHVYKDTSSAYREDSHKHRIGFNAMLDAVRKKRIKGFYVFRWNRFFRNVFKTGPVYEELFTLGAKAIATSNPYDIFSYEGRSRFVDEIVAAQKQSDQASVAIRVGKAFKASKGFSNSGVPAFGITRADGIDTWNDDAEFVRRAGEIYADGRYSFVTVASMISTLERRFNGHQVQNWFDTPDYFGEVRHTPTPFGKRYPSTAERMANPPQVNTLSALWPPELCDRIRLTRRLRMRGGRGVHTSNALVFGSRGMVCEACGQTLAGHTRKTADGGRTPTYMCHRDRRPNPCPDGRTSVNEVVLKWQLDLIFSFITPTPEWIAQAIEKVQDAQRDDDGIQRAKTWFRHEREALLDDLRTERIDALEYDLRLRAAKNEYQQRLPQTSRITAETITRTVEAMSNLRAQWREADNYEKRALWRLYFSRLWVNKREKRITRIAALPAVATILRGLPERFAEVEPNLFQVLMDLSPVYSRLPVQYALMSLGRATLAEIVDLFEWNYDSVRHQIVRLEELGRARRTGEKRGRWPVWEVV